MASIDEEWDALDEEDSTEDIDEMDAPASLPARAKGKKRRRLRDAVKHALVPHGGAPSSTALVRYGESGIVSSNKKSGKRHARRTEDLYDVEVDELRPAPQGRRLDEQAEEDMDRVVHPSMALLDPRDPLGFDELEAEAAATFRDVMHRGAGKGSSWYERTTSATWIKPSGVTRKYHKTISLDAGGAMRADMRYDALDVTLDRDAAEESPGLVRRHIVQDTESRITHGSSGQDYGDMRRIIEARHRAMVEGKGFRGPGVSDGRSMVETLGSVLMLTIKLVLFMAVVAAAIIGCVALLAYFQGQTVLTGAVFWQTLTHSWLEVLLALLALLALRRIVFRLNDKKVS